jgi:iron complex outermembrane recepter protein
MRILIMNMSRLSFGSFRHLKVSHAAGAAMALVLSAPAMAQTAPAPAEAEEEVSEITVTGYRAAIENAIELKREQVVIAEAFSAEDIGKLPDVSIAETLGRLPGLATQRLDGRSQVLSIRGLGPDYSSTLLNGREQVSSGDNRAVEYDQYPSELINSGVVYKTPYAGLIGQGLAGTVDLQTVRPLSKSDRIVAVSGRMEFNDGGSLNPDSPSKGYRATAVYVDQFADNTLGIALGAAYQSSPSQVERFRAWGYPDDSGRAVLGGMKPFAKSVELNRLGLFGTVEWKPSTNLTTSVDLFYADYKERQPQRGIEFPLNPGWGAGTTITSATPTTGFADAVTYTGVQPVVRNDYDSKDTTTFAAGWNTKYENDNVILNFDASYSRSKRDLEQIESYSGLSYAANPAAPSDTVSYTRTTPPGSDFPFAFKNVIDYSNTTLIQLTDPRGWGGGSPGSIIQAGFINDTETKDEMYALRGEVVGKVNSGLVKNLVAGFNYTDRTKSRDITQNFLSLSGGTTVFNGPGAILRKPIPAGALLTPTASLGFLGFGKQVTYDPRKLIADGTYILTDVQSSSLPFPGDWTVKERVATGYVRADLETDLGSVRVTGNIGAQLVFTKQSSNGFNSPGGIGAVKTPTSAGAAYSHFLPSLALNFDIADNMKIRFGAARTLARPRMDQLNASSNASINSALQGPLASLFGGSGGNPLLRPYQADGVDLSYEYYFDGGKGYVSVAGFYKWLDDFVNPNAGVVRDFTYLRSALTPAQRLVADNTTYLGVVTGPDNGAKGYIRGIEASLSLPFSTLTSALEGFGFQTSASYTDSKLKIIGTTARPTVPGLSKWVVNSTVYFEKSGFEIRGSHRFRSSYLAEFIGISASRDFRQTYPESIFDAQIGYRFQSGMLEGLSITAQALNLTNEPFINYQNNDKRQIIDYESYGRTFLIGASYKF